MSIFFIQPYQVGEVGQYIQRWKLVCSDSLAQVTAAGYLNSENLMGYTISPLDIIDCQYACAGSPANPGAGTYVELLPSIAFSGGVSVITLNQVVNSGDVLLPVVSGNIASFNGTTGQIKDSGVSASSPVFTAVSATTGTINNLKYGATPVAQVDPGSCTITAAAGAANTATVTVQLKDGSGADIARSVRFKVYASSAADGLTLASAASTGFSVASGGLSLNNGEAVATQIECMSSASGGCVLSLLDTGKQTSYLVLVLSNGNKISAQLSAGSYG